MEQYVRSIKEGIEDLENLSGKDEFVTYITKMVISNGLDLNEVFKLVNLKKWDNFCCIIKKIGYPHNSSAIPSLFYLLKDLNWPGAQDSLKLLISLGKEVVMPYTESAILSAHMEGDDMWLAGIKQLVLKLDIEPTNFKNPNIFKYLLEADY